MSKNKEPTMAKCKCGKEVKGTYKMCYDCFTKSMDKCPTCGKSKPKEYDLCFTCNQKKVEEDKAEFEIAKFASRFVNACVGACKNCKHLNLNPSLANALDLEDYDEKCQTVILERERCPEYKIWEKPEINTTYQGQTNAPSDNSNPLLVPDSTDINFDYKAPKRCLSFEPSFEKPIAPTLNNWELCLKTIFDIKRCDYKLIPNPKFEDLFPSEKNVLYLLNTSRIPEMTFRIDYPPITSKLKGMSKGLWFYKSEKFNSSLEKNEEKRKTMKRRVMVYLYNVWFKQLDDTKKEGCYITLDSGNPMSLAKDLAWWMKTVFKDETALKCPSLNLWGDVIVPEDETATEIEFIPISLLEKAQEAAILCEMDCDSLADVDFEAAEYEKLIEKYGYSDTFEGIIDKDGREILVY